MGNIYLIYMIGDCSLYSKMLVVLAGRVLNYIYLSTHVFIVRYRESLLVPSHVKKNTMRPKLFISKNDV